MITARPAWDFPTRAFHWALVVLVVFSFTTGKFGGGWMQWHMQSGYAILALLLFRFAWGFAGPAPARFASFLKGPKAAIGYARELLAGSRAHPAGHNPLGGWMVMATLAILLLQAATGLFSNDEVASEGPLAALVSNAVVDRMSAIHAWNSGFIAGAVVLHLLAIAFYQWRLREDLIGPMIAGPVDARWAALAMVLLAASAAAVYALVVVYPRP